MPCTERRHSKNTYWIRKYINNEDQYSVFEIRAIAYCLAGCWPNLLIFQKTTKVCICNVNFSSICKCWFRLKKKKHLYWSVGCQSMCNIHFKIRCVQLQQSCHLFKSHSCTVYLYNKASIFPELVTSIGGIASGYVKFKYK